MASQDVELKDDKVGIIGCGYFGSSWLMLYVRGGYRVSVYDISPDNMRVSLAQIRTELHQLEENGHGKKGFTAVQQFERITVCSSVEECVRNSILVQECIPEDLERKRELLKIIERHVQQDTIIVSFASALLPSLLSEHLDHKDNFAVVHSLKPTLLIKSTEVVPSPWTNTNTLERLTKILEGLGHLPIVLLKEIDGYAMNRIHHFLMAQCYQLVKGGYCDAVDVDTAMQEGLGQWYPFLGLFEIEHLNADGFVDLCKRYGNGQYQVVKSFLPPERMEGATVKAIHNSLCEIVPLGMLEEQRRFRIKALAALQKIKDNLDANDP